jgi:hypothetical protein
MLITQVGSKGVVEMEQLNANQTVDQGATLLVTLDAIAIAKLVSLSEEAKACKSRHRVPPPARAN